LRAALKAADRFRMHRIYMGTMQHWENLLEEANRFLKEATGPDDEEARALTVQLQAIVVARQLTAGRPTRSPLQF
jgi:hypothetical protein